MANKLHVLSRKEGAVKMQQQLWGRQPAPSAFLLPGWCLNSCFFSPLGGWSFAPQTRAWLSLHSWGCSCEDLFPLPHVVCALQIQQWHFPSGIHWLLPPSPNLVSIPTLSTPYVVWILDNFCPKSSCLRFWVQGQVQQGPTSKRCVFPDQWLDIFSKFSWPRWVFREDLNKEREEALTAPSGTPSATHHLCTDFMCCCGIVLVIMLVALVLALPVYFYSIVEFTAPELFILVGSW